MTEITIDTYRVMQAQGGSSYVGLHGYIQWEAQIQLFGENWQVFIFFLPDNVKQPDAFRSDVVLRYFMFLPYSRYEGILDLLRNEGPVTLTFADCAAQTACLSSGHEATGEGECCAFSPEVVAEDDEDETEVIERGYAPFEPNAQAHSWANAYLLALASYHVYGGTGLDAGAEFAQWYQDKFDPWMRQGEGAGEPRFDFISDEYGLYGTGFQAMIMSNDRFIGLIIRGSQWNTDTPGFALDWMGNINGFGPAPIPGIIGAFAHSGWMNSVNRVLQNVKSRLVDHRGDTSKPIWITGHSMGGSVGALIALMLANEGKIPVQGVYTFGAPPVGDKGYLGAATANGLQERTHRWVNDADPATYLNFSALFGTLHVGAHHMIDSSGARHLNFPLPVFPPFSLQIDDHTMTNYARILRLGLTTEQRRMVPRLVEDD